MKRIFLIIQVCFLSLFMLSCGSEDTSEITPPMEEEENPSQPESNGRILIVYFSRTGENYAVGQVEVGNTAVLAGYIKDYTEGDVFEIVPEVPYPTNYDEMRQVSQQETASNARPAIKNRLENLADYSTVFVGSPIWYAAPPMIMRTFYESYDLAGKTIIPFGTHEGSGVGSCTSLLKSYFPNASYLETFGMRGQDVRSGRQTVNAWLERLNLKKNN
ncbi:flavodoxin [Bacteroides timonensis]|uniref:flavodoxin n=1 Tax=Bacteroides timonensis TaxID=1470345 RepID=UPI0004BC9EFB|nr:flavodoxin [Bacteroides timonensis]